MQTRRLSTLFAAVVVIAALIWGGSAEAFLSTDGVTPIAITPATVPDYLTSPNWAYTPQIRKFRDHLPGLNAVTSYNLGAGYTGGKNELNQWIPIADKDITTFPDADYYEIELGEYAEKLHSDLPPTKLRGYRQVNTTGPANQFHYLGPVIIAQKGRPVRIKFINNLPTGAGGDLFIPVDTTVMGSGPFNLNYDPATRPIAYPAPDAGGNYPPATINGMFSQNRATLHLHGGRSPWISDGTPHQWITPAFEPTAYPAGVSMTNVPDMPDPGPGAQTFFWTNDQSSRLMFYHDHAWGITRLNVYVGEAAGYMIQDPVEIALITDGIIPADQIPLVIEDKTFVDGDPLSPTYVRNTDPTWQWGTGAVGADGFRTPNTGDLWWPHVYMPAQNPFDITGIAPMGRWAYAPYFYPAPIIANPAVANPYYNINCDPFMDPTPGTPLDAADIAWNEANVSGYTTLPVSGDPFCQAPEIPGTPNPSWGAEAFMDTPLVNGTVYPVLEVEPKAYRFRILNAAHDRFMALSLFKADTAVDPNVVLLADDLTTPMDEVAMTTASAAACAGFAGGCATGTEIRMVNAIPTPGWPATWPADGRAGGVPDPATAGPQWVMIGTEGGFLPQPVLIPPQPITWNTNPSMFNVGNINGGSLILGPAERADVIVDFKGYEGQTLLLYNDGSAPWPALNPQYDFYTGNPDGRDSGSADTTLPGLGPNTRTLMQIKVAAAPAAAAAFDVARLQDAFDSTANPTALPAYYDNGVFRLAQDPIIAGQGNMNPTANPAKYETYLGPTDFGGYNRAYNLSYPTTWPNWGMARINDKQINFVDSTGAGAYKATIAYPAPNNTLALKQKSIHDEMGATFDDYGRMRAALGLELNNAMGAMQVNFVVQTYSDPSTELLDPDVVQVWKITHNGVDTHPIHFHLFDVQVLNRVGWDGFIRLPDPTEMGWKDTVRISPLEDTIVALRPVKAPLPFGLPRSSRPLNPATPLGDNTELSPVDPTTGQAWLTPNLNRVVDFGWEYVWHCHILSHEENDMMRSVIFNVVEAAPAAPVINSVTWMGGTLLDINWTDNSTTEFSFRMERSINGGAWTQIGTDTAKTGTGTVTVVSDNAVGGNSFLYRVVAIGASGEVVSNTMGYAFILPTVPGNLQAAAASSTAINLSWVDSSDETSYQLQRKDGDCASANPWADIAVPAINATGYSDTGLTSTTAYAYQIRALNSFGPSAWSNCATATTLALEAPTNLTAQLLQGPTSVSLAWQDNSVTETGFVVERRLGFGAFSVIATLGANVTAYNDATVVSGTYGYRVRAINGAVSSAYSNTATVLVAAIPAAPSNVTVTAVRASARRDTVTVRWTDNSTNESGFTIQRATNAAFTAGLATYNAGAGPGSGTVRSLNINANRNMTYYYRVQSRNGNGTSVWVNATPFPIITP